MSRSITQLSGRIPRTQEIVDEIAGDDGVGKYHDVVGLNLSTYFSGPKIKWILDNIPGAVNVPNVVICFWQHRQLGSVEPNRRC